MAPLTERDKKLLGFLAVILVLFLFGRLLIFPQLERYMDLDSQIALAELDKYEMDVKMVSVTGSRKLNEELQTKLQEVSSAYYPMMDSQEIDREVTGFFLESGLEIENLEITMPSGPSKLEAYRGAGTGAQSADGSAGTGAQSAGGSAGTDVQSADGSAGTDAQGADGSAGTGAQSADGGAGADAQSADGSAGTDAQNAGGSTAAVPASVQPEEIVQNQVYAAQAVVKCIGTQEQTTQIIDFLAGKQAVALTGYTFDTQSVPDETQPDGKKTQTIMTVGLQLFMCDAAEGLE